MISLSPVEILIAIAFGFGTGVLGAVLGTGGGVFLVPLMILGLDVPAHFAIATSILCVIATSSAVASANVDAGTANMPLGMTLEIATALGAICGSWAATLLRAMGLGICFRGCPASDLRAHVAEDGSDSSETASADRPKICPSRSIPIPHWDNRSWNA